MIRPLLGKFWLLCAGLIILFAVLLTLSRVLLPYSGLYHDEIEDWLSRVVGQPVEIGAITGEWHGLGPRLVLRDVSLVDPETGGALARFATAGVDIDLLHTVLHAEPRIDRFVLSGVRLTIERTSDGGLVIAGRGWPEGRDDNDREDERQKRLLSWVLSQGRLALEAAEITWIEPRADGAAERRFTQMDLELRNDRGRHQLSGSAELPAALGDRFAFALDVIGNPLETDWEARVWIRGSGLLPAGWLQGHDFGGMQFADGEAGIELWSRWRNGHLTTVEGRLDGGGFELASLQDGNRGAYRLDRLGGDFAWRAAEEGWRVDVNRLVIARNGQARPAAGLVLALDDGEESSGAPAIRARLTALRAEDVLELLRLTEWVDGRGHEALSRLSPEGALHDIRIDIGTDIEAGEDLRIAGQATFADVRNHPWSGIPGTEALGGRVIFDADGGHVDLEIGAGRLDFDDLFRGPLPVGSLQGRISWQRGEEGWRVSAEELDLRNEDLDLTAWGRLDLPASGDATPFLSLFAHFTAHTVENTGRYLPTRIMPPNTVEWLDRSILGGHSPRGDLVLHGPLGGFPYADGSGRFKVDFDLEQGTLQYHPEWPRLERIAAQITFEGEGMTIDADDGRSFSTRITQARVEIPNLNGRPAVLEVDGHAHGLTVDALHFLRESPLSGRFGTYADEADASGPSSLDLRLTIPLDGSPAHVDGGLHFEDSMLTLFDDMIEISRVNGLLNFTESGVSAEAIAADLLGLPARIVITPELGDGTPGTLIEASGTADDHEISGLLDLPPLRHLDGRTEWLARLRIPFVDDADDGVDHGGALLEVESDLVGLAFTLPEPMTRAADEPAPLRVSIPLPRALGAPVTVGIGEMLSAVFTLDDDLRPDRGELRFGGGRLEMPGQSGLRISGEAKALSFAEWAAVFDNGEAAGQGEEGERKREVERGNITSLDLHVDRAELFGRDFHALTVDAWRDGELWRADVSSEEMTGRLDVPLRDGMVWRLQLEHLHIAALENGNGVVESAVDPRTLPPMRIESESFSYGGIDFGRLSMVSSRRDAGMHLNKLSLASSGMQVDARGDWVVAGDRQFSSFEIRFDTEDFGAALSNFGYAGTIRGGKGKTGVVARWRGPPTAFALNRLDGSMDMTIEDGRLLEVEPGAGRIFGLISLQALPRRLTLDFSDFFGRGFSFDRIAGSFSVREGVATTDNLTISGPAARVEARGEIDLAARQYDQIVDVYPNVTSGLPVAGVVAGGFGVGAAILLAERIFRSDIDRITRITYEVTGPWAEPSVRRLQEDAQSGKR